MFNMLNHCKCLISPKNIFKMQCVEYIRWSPINKISTNPKNHYETLNLSRNCTSKEIRDAFITLSKQYHPDKNKGNPKAQENFVRVSEAYNVLIKPESRRQYDFGLSSFSDSNPSRVYKSGKKDDFYEVHRYDSHYRDPWKDPSFYRNRNFDEEDKNDNYYGVRGIKKQRNDQILFWIVVFAGVGLFLQIAIIRFANSNIRASRDKQSEDNRRYLEYVRARAEHYGTRERQIEALLRRAGINKLEEDDIPEKDTKK